MIQYSEEVRMNRSVRIWLIAGLLMIFMQIVIGGVTRLTGSGLSITKWEVVKGAKPPLNESEWLAAFDLYKQTPQYQRINQGMTLPEFKFIYFWEYFHRLWARLMFFVFIFPFGWFLYKGQLSRRLMLRLVVVVLLAGLEGFFGWIMVKSGLIYRPWVNAYNLTLHLSMGILIFAYLLWTAFIAFNPKPAVWSNIGQRRWGWVFVGLTFFQIVLGAMMSGTKAGLFFPTWPKIGSAWMPAMLLHPTYWQWDSFLHYDTNPFVPALIQFLHRNVAYMLVALFGYFTWSMYRKGSVVFSRAKSLVWALLSLQVLLGILTLINCIGTVPVDLGVYHQGCAVLLLGAFLNMAYQLSGKSPSNK